MTPKSFRFEVQDGVGLLTFNRPDVLNALTFEVYRELKELLPQIDDDKEVGALVITGAGRGFCSGGDVNEIIGQLLTRTSPELLEFTRLTCAVIKAIRSLRKPVIAAVNGVAAGAGAVIALASDLRLASSEAKIAFLFSKVGLAGADMGAGYLLPRVVGLSRATELLYFGDAIDAATAERYGLFNRVVAPDALVPEAKNWAKRLSEGPTFALGITKELLNSALGDDLYNALDHEAHAQAICLQTQDFKEAYRAFTEKRAPRFVGG